MKHHDEDAVALETTGLTLSRVEVFVFEDSAPAPVKSWFGAPKQRTSLLLRVGDDAGHHGWGEVWSGHPSFGAYHRAQLLEHLVAPLAMGRNLSDIPSLTAELGAALMAVQRLAGEPGPVSHVMAGLDCALWDLVSRARGVPLYERLGGVRRPLPAYASGVSAELSKEGMQALRQSGFRAFKFKAGFAGRRSLDDVAEAVLALDRGEKAMIDANCGWNLRSAAAALRHIEGLPLEWVEEPIGSECPAQDWRDLAALTSHRLAGGENMLASKAFHESLEWLDVIQPDLGKWGGVSEVLPLAARARAVGRRYCPHAFGSNVGLAFAAHVLCAAGGDGFVEIDANPNPLRTLGSKRQPVLVDGHLILDEEPGIGVDVDLDALKPFLRMHAVIDRTIPASRRPIEEGQVR